MATSQTRTNPFTTTYAQFKDAGEQVLDAGRKAGALYVDSYEQAVDRALELETEFASGSRQEWLQGLVQAHVDLSRELTSSYTAAVRTLLR